MDNIYVPTTYEAYLQTEEFDQIRQAVFSRDGRKCVVCGSTETLQPHHLTYDRLYHEEISDLITLCRRCHSIYHAIDKRREALATISRYKELEQSKQDYEAKYNKIEAESKLITEEIKTEYLPKDYCRNGDLDMMDWAVLNPIIERKCEEHGIDYWQGNKTKLRNYFHYRRCEFFLKCIDKGITRETMINKTKFDPQYLSKWYRRDKCQAKLNEEKELYKED